MHITSVRFYSGTLWKVLLLEAATGMFNSGDAGTKPPELRELNVGAAISGYVELYLGRIDADHPENNDISRPAKQTVDVPKSRVLLHVGGKPAWNDLRKAAEFLGQMLLEHQYPANNSMPAPHWPDWPGSPEARKKVRRAYRDAVRHMQKKHDARLKEDAMKIMEEGGDFRMQETKLIPSGKCMIDVLKELGIISKNGSMQKDEETA